MSRLTYRQLSAELGVAVGTLKRWKLCGMPAHVTKSLDHRVTFDLDSVRTWIAARRADPNKQRRLRSITFHRDACVYFAVRDDGLVKIGFTSDPTRREAELNKAQALKFRIVATIPGDKRLELAFHEQFASDRLDDGSELFAPSDRLRRLLKALTGSRAA